MAVDPGPTTRYDWVDARLQAEIALGNLPPGDRVKVNDLAAEWKVSPTPLREAVQRLAARGVLTMSPQRGARVADVSVEEVRDLYGLRVQLEPQALHSSVANSDASHLTGLTGAYVELVGLLERAPSNPPTAFELYNLHRAFHEATMARCTSPWLLRLVGVLMDQSMRYMRYVVDLGAPRLEEHGRIVECVAAGDADAAATLLTEHLKQSAEHVAGALAQARVQAP